MEARERMAKEVLGRILYCEFTDGRKAVGKFECMDSVGSVFLADCLELHDWEADHYYEHFLFKNLFKNPEDRRYVVKYCGSIVVPPQHIQSLKVHQSLTDHMLKHAREEIEKIETAKNENIVSYKYFHDI